MEVHGAILLSLDHTHMLMVSWLKMKASGILFHASFSDDFSHLNFALKIKLNKPGIQKEDILAWMLRVQPVSK